MNLSSYTRAEIGITVLSVNICDLIYYRCKGFGENLFLIIDIQGVYDHKKGKYINPVEAKQRFYNFLTFIRTNKHFVSDYQFEYGKKHCIVLSIPSKFKQSYEYFLTGQYSKMYDLEQIKEYWSPFHKVGQKNTPEPNRNYAVLTKDKDIGKVVLKQAVRDAYGVESPPENPQEYDILWETSEEILNYDYANEQERNFFRNIKLNK